MKATVIYEVLLQIGGLTKLRLSFCAANSGRNPERLKQAALELDAQRTAAFDAKDPASLHSFFLDLPTPIDHVMVTAGAPHYGPPLEMPPEEARRGLTEHLLLALEVARGAANKVRPPGSLIFMGGGSGPIRNRRHPPPGAVVAASILTTVYHMLRDGTCYQDLGPEYFTRRNPAKAAARLANRIRNLGYHVEIRAAA